MSTRTAHRILEEIAKTIDIPDSAYEPAVDALTVAEALTGGFRNPAPLLSIRFEIRKSIHRV